MSNKPFIIVVGIDYSAHAERALSAAYEQAKKHGSSEVHVVHVAQPITDSLVPAVPLTTSATTPGLSLAEQKDRLLLYLTSNREKLVLDPGAHGRVIAHVVLDTPMVGLTSLASDLEADLIVVGTHGRNGVARWLLGSVAEGVMRQASCPVLVIPPERQALKVPSIEPPCPRCSEARKASGGQEMWCEQHRERHGRRHTYHQGDRAAAETNMPLTVR